MRERTGKAAVEIVAEGTAEATSGEASGVGVVVCGQKRGWTGGVGHSGCGTGLWLEGETWLAMLAEHTCVHKDQ